MLEKNRSTFVTEPADVRAACRKVGHFIAKGGCFALRDGGGTDAWLEIEPVPLHLLDEEVEIVGRLYGNDLIWVQSIAPTGRRS